MRLPLSTGPLQTIKGLWRSILLYIEWDPTTVGTQSSFLTSHITFTCYISVYLLNSFHAMITTKHIPKVVCWKQTSKKPTLYFQIMRPYFHLPACVTDELGEMTQNNVGVVPGRQRSGRALSRWDQLRDRVTHTAPPSVLNTGCQTFLGLARQKYVEVGGRRQGPQLNRPKNPKFFNSLIYPFQDLNIPKVKLATAPYDALSWAAQCLGLSLG